MTAANVRAAIREVATPERAAASARFFKTGKGEYGEGDVFVGLSVPQLRVIAREFATLSMAQTLTLLKSKIHEERLIALIILETQFVRAKKDPDARQAIVDAYLAHTAWVNNWDLVDSSAHQILGAHLLVHPDGELLRRLAKSKSLWEKRIAMIATYAFIRAGHTDETYAIAELLLDDEHDLIHKAVGWMLRETGKHVDDDELRGFLTKHAKAMPRTALRYAIERLPPDERKRWLVR